MDVYAYNTYVDCLRDAMNQRRATQPSFTMARVATQSKIQRTYLSHVMAGRAHLNRDQLFALSETLNIEDDAREYLMLLLDIERCAIPKRKEQLLKQATTWRSRHSRSERALNREARLVSDQSLFLYYSDPLCSLVHMMLTIEKYSSNPKKICHALDINDERLGTVLRILEDCRILQIDTRGKMTIEDPNIHIRDNHPVAKSHALNFRTLAVQHYQMRQRPDDYTFTATVAANDEVKAQFKAELLALLKRLGKNVEEASSDTLFHINIDLFSPLRDA
jgi:uncharacterized protein (TIGR02147 family)